MNRESTGGGPITGLKEGLAKDWEDLAWHSGSRNTVLERTLEIHSGGEAAENQVGQRAENENARWEKGGAEPKPQVVTWELLAVSLRGKWAHGRVYSQIRSTWNSPNPQAMKYETGEKIWAFTLWGPLRRENGRHYPLRSYTKGGSLGTWDSVSPLQAEVTWRLWGSLVPAQLHM